MDNSQSNEWQMGSDWYDLVAKEASNLLYAQREAQQDPRAYDEWFEQLCIFSSIVGATFKKEDDYKDIDKNINVLRHELGLEENKHFSLNLSDKHKRYDVHKKLFGFQSWLFRKAYQNDLLIRRSYRDPNQLYSGA